MPVREKENGLWRWLRTRLLTFGMVLAMAFLMVVSLIMSAVVAALVHVAFVNAQAANVPIEDHGSACWRWASARSRSP